MARELSFKAAVIEAIDQEMERDPLVFMIGQTVSEHDDHFNAGISVLARKYGPGRLRPTALVERLEAGAGVGAALAGARPIVDLCTAAFGSLAFDEVFGRAALWTYEHGGNGEMKVPIVFRLPYTSYGTSGAEHSRSPLANYMHGPGIATVVPSTPADAKGLMITAIRSDFPVAYFEPAPLAAMQGVVPEDPYEVPLGIGVVRRPGADCTVVAVGYQVSMAIDAADELAASGIDVEVIDPRSLVPLDLDLIVASVAKTGRLVVVAEDFARCGVGAEITFQVQAAAFDQLRAPVARVEPMYPAPASPELNRLVMPSKEKIVGAVRQTVDRVAAVVGGGTG